MKQQRFSLSKRIRSFEFALNGLKILTHEEHNFIIHLLAAMLVIFAGFVFHLSTLEWAAIVFAIGFVIALEIINTSIETIADFIMPEKHDKIRRIKDLAAAGVLVSAITALIIGVVIFLPKILIYS